MQSRLERKRQAHYMGVALVLPALLATSLMGAFAQSAVPTPPTTDQSTTAQQVTPPATPSETPAAAPQTLATQPVAQPAPPPPRLGPLGAAKSWGYQLSGLDPLVLAAAPYDVLVIDYSRDGSDAKVLTAAELDRLRTRPDGTRRVVLAYLSIGEAESYRYYWKWYWRSFWILPNPFAPNWRRKPNGDWGGNYAVRYWDPSWQQIIVGPDGYLDRILKAGFDGVWLDKVDSSLEEVAANNPDAKKQMVDFVRKIAERGRAARPGFLVVPQNGEELLDDAGYRALIDGIGKESLLYGEDAPGVANADALVARRRAHLDLLTAERKTVLAVEYLDRPDDIARARLALEAMGYVPHFASRDLDRLRVGDQPSAAGKSDGARSRK